MKSYSVIGLFCEDIRREESGQETVIGTLPDTLRVNQLPGIFPKMAIYVRAMFDISYDLKHLSYNLIGPDGTSLQKIEVPDDVREKAFSAAAEKESPLVGLKTMSVFSPVSIPQEGQFEIKSTVNRNTFLCGFLRVTLDRNSK